MSSIKLCGCEHGSVTAAFLRKNYCAAHAMDRKALLTPKNTPEALKTPVKIPLTNFFPVSWTGFQDSNPRRHYN